MAEEERSKTLNELIKSTTEELEKGINKKKMSLKTVEVCQSSEIKEGQQKSVIVKD